ncbi:cyclic lactone autoinducer peptide [Ruthenibacterium lactatiformans]
MSFHGTISRCFHLRSFTQPFIARPKRPSALQQKLLRAVFAAGGRPEFFSGCFVYPKIPPQTIHPIKNRRYIMKKCEKGFFKACSKFIGKAAKIGANDRCYGLHYQPKKPAALKK